MASPAGGILKATDRLADRFELIEAAEAPGPIRRWRAMELSTGDRVELLVVPLHRDAEVVASFANQHAALVELGWETKELIRTAKEVIAVRPDRGPGLLSQVKGPMDRPTVEAIGAMLAAQLLERPFPGVAFSGADVRFDEDGMPIIAPLGRALNRVQLGAEPTVDPLVRDGMPASVESSLFGLGQVLHRLATGKSSGPATFPGLVGDLNGRRAAAQRLASGEVPDLRPLAKKVSRVGEVKLTVGSAEQIPSSQRRAAADPSNWVMVPASDLAALSPSHKSAVAGTAGVPLATVSELLEKRLPLVVSRATSRAGARKVLAELEGIGVEASTPSRVGWLPVLGVAGTLGIGAVGVGFAVILVLLGLPWVALLALLLTVGVGAVSSLGTGVAALAGTADTGAAEEAAEVADRLKAAQSADGLLSGCWSSIAEMRAALGKSALPEVVELDLRDSLKELEVRLHDLAAEVGDEVLVGHAESESARARVRKEAAEIEESLATVRGTFALLGSEPSRASEAAAALARTSEVVAQSLNDERRADRQRAERASRVETRG